MKIGKVRNCETNTYRIKPMFPKVFSRYRSLKKMVAYGRCDVFHFSVVSNWNSEIPSYNPSNTFRSNEWHAFGINFIKFNLIINSMENFISLNSRQSGSVKFNSIYLFYNFRKITRRDQDHMENSMIYTRLSQITSRIRLRGNWWVFLLEDYSGRWCWVSRAARCTDPFSSRTCAASVIDNARTWLELSAARRASLARSPGTSRTGCSHPPPLRPSNRWTSAARHRANLHRRWIPGHLREKPNFTLLSQ